MRARFSLLTPTLRWFLLGMVLANIASAMVFTVASLYMADLGASVGQIGMVFTLAGIVPLILQVFGGWLSDFNRAAAHHCHRQQHRHPGLPGIRARTFLGMAAPGAGAGVRLRLAGRSQLRRLYCG